jgi:hypothetical protein
MNKLLVLLFLSFTIACSAWAEKYEYVRIFGQQEPVTLNSGDIAWWVNYYNTDYIYQFDQVGMEIGSHRWLMSSAVGGVSQISRTFIGPCKLGLRTNESSRVFVTLKILRTSESGYKTLEWDGSKYAGTTITDSSDGSQQASNGVNPTSIKYDELLGWAYFTDTNWVYSYTNLSWYYMHPTSEGFYVWNANLPENGWTKLERG